MLSVEENDGAMSEKTWPPKLLSISLKFSTISLWRFFACPTERKRGYAGHGGQGSKIGFNYFSERPCGRKSTLQTLINYTSV
jgi:hypothetical protein